MRAVMLALLLGGPSTSDQQFNLVCSGTLSTKSFYGGDKVENYRYLYRLDLDQKKWCPESCTVIKPIHDLQPGMIVLNPPENVNTSTEKKFTSGYIDRRTGMHSILSTSGRRTDILILEWKGRCEKHPFEGFPEVETKF